MFLGQCWVCPADEDDFLGAGDHLVVKNEARSQQNARFFLTFSYDFSLRFFLYNYTYLYKTTDLILKFFLTAFGTTFWPFLTRGPQDRLTLFTQIRTTCREKGQPPSLSQHITLRKQGTFTNRYGLINSFPSIHNSIRILIWIDWECQCRKRSLKQIWW